MAVETVVPWKFTYQDQFHEFSYFLVVCHLFKMFAAVVLLGFLTTILQAFSPTFGVNQLSRTPTRFTLNNIKTAPSLILRSTGKGDGGNEATNSEVETPPPEAAETVAVDDSTDLINDEAEDQLDDEEEQLKAELKDKIDSLTKSIKTEMDTLQKHKDTLDKNSQNGYARLGADLQNYKRRVAESSKSTKTVQKAKVLKQFMPLLAKFDEIKSTFAGDAESDDSVKSLISSYSGIESSFMNEFTKLGAREFHAVEGEDFSSRLEKEETEEYSDTVAKGSVIRETRRGFELDGEIIERAMCVVSLGKEKAADVEKAAETETETEEVVHEEVVDES